MLKQIEVSCNRKNGLSREAVSVNTELRGGYAEAGAQS